MSLLELWNATPQQFEDYQVWQIVSFSGDGRLKDNSEASIEFRKFLTYQSSRKLFTYIKECLQENFQNSGLVLQDIVNELGRRLGYDVENGVYRGRKGQIGYDGAWTSPSDQVLVVEVKTTDAYRINLDTIVGYRESLVDGSGVKIQFPILIVVGRQDTGDFEAQIRGSRHAWDVRLISAEALSRLVSLKEAGDVAMAEKIRSLLVPREYTRLDELIDVLFHTSEEVRTPAKGIYGIPTDHRLEELDRRVWRGSRNRTPLIGHEQPDGGREKIVNPLRIKSKIG